jgi:hypothetical protein
MKFSIQLILSAIGLVFSSMIFAQIPDTQYSKGISYISGGVGEGESQAILAEAKQWPLLLELSQLENGRGVWIFGAKVKILNAQSQVIFDAQSDGPYMLINLSSGQYQIEASYQGVVQKKSLSFQGSTPQKLAIFWK